MSAVQRLAADIAAGHTIIIDGATGTEIERRGAAMYDGAWCAMATRTHPEVLRSVHEAYIRAGAQLITTNTFSTTRNMLEPAGLNEQFEFLLRRSVELALEARARCGAQGQVVVAGSMSHQVPIERGGAMRMRRHVPPPSTARARFEEAAGMFAELGVDLLLLEMMSDPDLANLAIEAAAATGLPLWVGYSVRAGDDGSPVAYTRPEISAAQMFQQIPLPAQVAVSGIMHSSADVTTPALEQLRAHWPGPLMAYPDSGYFRMPHWQFENIMPTDEFVSRCQQWIDDGVQIVGGCCGLGLEHIEALTRAFGHAGEQRASVE